jgi:hypothetical protein
LAAFASAGTPVSQNPCIRQAPAAALEPVVRSRRQGGPFDAATDSLHGFVFDHRVGQRCLEGDHRLSLDLDRSACSRTTGGSVLPARRSLAIEGDALAARQGISVSGNGKSNAVDVADPLDQRRRDKASGPVADEVSGT